MNKFAFFKDILCKIINRKRIHKRRFSTLYAQALLGLMMSPATVRYNLESVATSYSLTESPFIYIEHDSCDNYNLESFNCNYKVRIPFKAFHSSKEIG